MIICMALQYKLKAQVCKYFFTHNIVAGQAYHPVYDITAMNTKRYADMSSLRASFSFESH